MTSEQEEPGPVTLDQLLLAREQRVLFRRHLGVENPGMVLIQLTINFPGSVKNSRLVKKCFHEGLQAIEAVMPGGRRLYFKDDSLCGPAGWLAGEPDLSARETKRNLTSLESSHPLGRLWDIDVFSPEGRGLSRRDLNLGPRTCYVCDQPAHDCVRNRRHTVSELTSYLTHLLEGYFESVNEYKRPR